MKDTIVFDIETEGFRAADDEQITVVGFYPTNDSPSMYLNAQDFEVDRHALQREVQQESGLDVDLKVYGSETAMIEGIEHFLDKIDPETERLAAYNGETWNGSGFDLSFLRTRLLKTGNDWIFAGIPYVDLMDPVKKRLNTKVRDIDLQRLTINQLYTEFGPYIGVEFEKSRSSMNKPEIVETIESHEVYSEDVLLDWIEETGYDIKTSRSQNTLDGAHEALMGEEDTVDPFDSSGEAVQAYKYGDLKSVVLHNLSDIKRTRDILHIVENFVWNDMNNYQNNVDEQIL